MSSCAICNTAGARACTRCRSISYCSRDCQQKDWSSHRLLCAQFHAQPPRPSPSHRRAILLRPEAKTPQLEWVRCTKVENHPDYGTYELNDGIDTLMLSSDSGPTTNYSGITRVPFHRNIPRKRDLDHTIEASFRDNFLHDGSTSNQAVHNVTKGKAVHDWRGPMVFMRKKELGYNPLSYEDITLQDFRDVVDYLIYYGNPQFENTGYSIADVDALMGNYGDDELGKGDAVKELDEHEAASRPPWRKKLDELKRQQADIDQKILHPREPTHDEMIEWIRDIKQMQALSAPKLLNSTLTKRRLKSVRVNCVGDLHSDKGKFTAVEMPGGHPFFEDGFQASPISPVSKLVGFPVRGKRQPRYPDSDNTPESYDNPAAAHLFTEMDPRSPHWGFSLSRLYWGYQVGSIVLMRDDGEDLTVEQAEALCGFCQVVVAPLLEDALVEAVAKETIMDMISPQLFEQTIDLVRDQRNQVQALLKGKTTADIFPLNTTASPLLPTPTTATTTATAAPSRPSLWDRKDSKLDTTTLSPPPSVQPLSPDDSTSPPALAPSPFTRAVRISCVADTTPTSPKHIALALPPTHPAFSAPIAPLSRLAGLPVRCWRDPSSTQPPATPAGWVSSSEPDARVASILPPAAGDNPEVSHLMIEWEDMRHPFWGFASPAWQRDVGSVVVVRADGGDLDVAVCRALVEYVVGRCQPLFEEALQGKRERGSVVGRIGPGEWVGKGVGVWVEGGGVGGGGA